MAALQTSVPPSSLTAWERELLRLAEAGATGRQTARAVGLCEGTVRNRVEAARQARAHGPPRPASGVRGGGAP